MILRRDSSLLLDAAVAGISGSLRHTMSSDGLPVGNGVTDEIRSISQSFERASALTVIGWAVQRFGRDLLLLSSFQDCVLIDLATRVYPSVMVAFSSTRNISLSGDSGVC